METMQEQDAFGALLRHYRRARGLTQELLAEKAGVGVRSIQGLERNAHRPQRDTVRRLALALALTEGQRAQIEALAQPAPRHARGSTPLATPLPAAGGTARPPVTSTRGTAMAVPVAWGAFVGRIELIATTQLLLATTRLLTLTGVGGSGKTRLAWEAAVQAIADGTTVTEMVWVNLAPLVEPGLMVTTIAQALGVRLSDDHTAVDGVAAQIGERPLLLILDNFEQILSASVQVVRLLDRCPRLHVMVTSRAPLQVYGERELAVPPLTSPPPTTLSVDRAARYEAVQLFIARARDVVTTFTLDTRNVAAVVDICHRLDGLPLAIELAAMRSKILSPQAILRRLEHRFPLLTASSPNIPQRHQTLRGAIAWSYDLLDPNEQALFQALSLFAGGATLQAIAAVCLPTTPDSPEIAALDQVTALVNSSLLTIKEQSDGEPRVLMLETVREFALECLAASGRDAELRRAHATYYQRWVEGLAPQLMGAEQAHGLADLEQEHDNLRAALRWTVTTGEVERGLSLAAALTWFWLTHGHLGEGRRWLEALLALDRYSDPAVQAHIRAQALNCVGILADSQGDYDDAATFFTDSLAIYRALGDRKRIATAINNIALVMVERGDYVQADLLYDESLSLRRDLGDRAAVAESLNNRGLLAVYQGDIERAVASLQQNVHIWRDENNPKRLASALNNLGLALREQGNWAGAAGLYAESLTLSSELGDKWCLIHSLEGIACIAHMRGRTDRGARLIGAAQAIRATVGLPMSPPERAIHDRMVAQMRAAVGDALFEAACVMGMTLTPERAVAAAQDEVHSLSPADD